MTKNRIIRYFLMWICCLSSHVAEAVPTLQDGGAWAKQGVTERRLNELDGLAHHHATGLVQDRQGMIWVATWNGLSRYDGYRFVSFKPKAGDGCSMGVNRIKDIRIRDPYIYCNAEGYCFVFDIRTGRFDDSHLSWNKALRKWGFSSQGTKRLKTADGVEWAVDSLGVRMSYRKPCYATWLLRQPGCQVRALFRDREGRIWVCSRDDASVRIYDANLNLLGFLGADGRLHGEKTPFQSAVYTMLQDEDGSLWLGCKPGGLLHLLPRADGSYDISRIALVIRGRETEHHVYSMQKDRWGRLWVSTLNHGLFCLTRTGKSWRCQPIVLSHDDKTGKYLGVRMIYISHRDELLVGTTLGLFATKLTADNPASLRFTLHEREGGRDGSLSCSAVMFMAEDRANRLYICTEGSGLNMVEPGVSLISKDVDFRHFDRRDLPEDFLLSAFAYGQYMWFVGTNDLTGVDVEHGLSLYFNHRTWTDELIFSDAQPLRWKGGKWLMGLMDGLVLMDMDLLTKRTKAPRIVLTRVSVEEGEMMEAVSARDTICLDETERNVKIEFAAIDYANIQSISYRFQLDGGVWNTLENSHTVTLLNLSPGTHTLRVESKLPTGQWAGNVKVVTICVKPTIWQTTTAKVLYVLLALLFIYTVVYVTRTIRASHRKQRELLGQYLDLMEKYDKEKHLVVAVKAAGADKTAVEVAAKAAEKKTTAEKTTAEKTAAEKATIETATAETMAVEAVVADGQQPLQADSRSVGEESLSEEDQRFMQCVVEFVEQHIDNSDLSVTDLATKLNVSKSGLNRKLKSLLGVAPKEFINKARMNRAVALLRHSDLPVKEIAYRCGFSDQNYFGKCFRAAMGVSPSEYRQKNGL